MDMTKYRDLFLSEARDHLQGMSDCLMALEKDPSASDSIDELFRHAHSVKGMAASMGYGKIAELSHRMEDMMDAIRKGRARFSRPFMDLLFAGVDSLEAMVGVVERGEALEALDSSELVARAAAAAEGKDPGEASSSPSPGLPVAPSATLPVAPSATPPAAPSATLPVAPSAPPPAAPSSDLPPGAFEVRFTLSPDCQVPAARGYLAVKKLQSLGTVLLLDPPLEKIKAGETEGTVRAVMKDASPDEVRGMLAGLPEMGEIAVTGGEPASAPLPPLASLPPLEPLAPSSAPGLPGPPSPRPPVSPSAAPPPPPAPRTAPSKSVRISVDLLDTFINLVGELIVTKSRLAGLLGGRSSREVDEGLTRLDQLIGTFHAEVMKVRMMPLETVTARLPRVVRDLARSRGKDALLAVEGASIELDRAILDELGDPLIHILRNAVDHGLEEGEARSRAGKDPVGHIVIRAYRERDMVHVEIADDGRGMDLVRVRAKAVEKGLIEPEQAALMSEEETIMLVCRPGFSTLDQVTDVSGRGVGMDVVRSVVESLGGNLVIRTRAGQGTTFLLKLPLTVAIVKMLLVRVGDHTLGLPITRVIRTVRATAGDLQQSQSKRYLTLGEELVPLYETRSLLALPGGREKGGGFPVVLVEATNRTAGLVVDEILGQEDIVAKPLCYPLEHLSRYSGMTVLGDGRIVPILDLKSLLV